jgi:hypothetical protein
MTRMPPRPGIVDHVEARHGQSGFDLHPTGHRVACYSG